MEDFHGTATVLAFGEAWEGYHDLLSQDAPLLIRGSVSGRDRDEEAPPIFLDSAVPLASLRGNGTLGVEVLLQADMGGDPLRAALEALRKHPGEAPVFVSWDVPSAPPARTVEESDVAGSGVRNGSGVGGAGATRLRSRSLRVAPSESLLSELRSLLGAERIRLVKA